MITIERARKILKKKGEKMSDGEVKNLVNHLAQLCNRIINGVFEKEDKF